MTPPTLARTARRLALLAVLLGATTAHPAHADNGANTSSEDGEDDDRWQTQLGDGAALAARGSARAAMAKGASAGDVPPGTPAVAAVIAAAYAAAGLDHDPSRSWIRRARLSGLVPWLTVRTTRDTSWQDDQSEVGHGTTLELRATWRLDRLLFDSRELQVASVGAGRHRERRRLSTRVIRAYFAWRRAAAGASETDERAAMRLAEATAELDALTDGWFSRALTGQKRP